MSDLMNTGTDEQSSTRMGNEWCQEIIRETEHYYQGEIQHEQRASWLLATAGLLVAVLLSLGSVTKVTERQFTSLAIGASFVTLAGSAILSIITILPLRGISPWRDLFGTLYRRERRKTLDELIEERFRPGVTWTVEKYEKRIKYHYRSHYLRFVRKAYGILWATRLLFLGMLCFVVAGLSALFPIDVLGLLTSFIGILMPGSR